MSRIGQRRGAASLIQVKPPSWMLWPLVAAMALGLVGLWTRSRVEKAMETSLSEHLETILRTEVTALRLWLQETTADAEGVARDDWVCELAWQLKEAADLTPTNRRSLLSASPQALLRAHLEAILGPQGYTGYLVMSREGRILASDCDELIGRPWEKRNSFPFQGAVKGRATILPPYASSLLLPDSAGRLRCGAPSLVALAPLCHSNGNIFGVIGLRVAPEGKFSGILAAGDFGKTGHTFAFNKHGVLLSSSWFDPAFKALGLLPNDKEARSILSLELRDPLVDLRRGKAAPRPRDELPLTRMAASATAGGSGVDVAGYRDVRGVKVIGAWAWMPRYQMGIATEVDASEAYEPVWVLRNSFLVLFLLLSACALGLLLLMFLVERLKQSVQSAESQLEQLGQYSLERLIGRGGCGAVYRAHHRFLRRPVAIKLLDSMRVDGETLERFEREVQLTSNLTHPNTVSIYDYGRTSEGVFYYAMEYLEGISLEELVGRFGPQPPGRVIHILSQVCGSLAEAHGIGLAHRDIKPPNILITCRGGVPDVVKVVDFGLVEPIEPGRRAHASPDSVVAGTPLYLPRERIEQPALVDVRSDLYSLGAVGYFLLTGRPIFDQESVAEIFWHQVHTLPKTPSAILGRAVAPDLERILMQCLAKDSADRPQSATALAEALGQCEATGSWTESMARSWWKKSLSILPGNGENGVANDPRQQPGAPIRVRTSLNRLPVS